MIYYLIKNEHMHYNLILITNNIVIILIIFFNIIILSQQECGAFIYFSLSKNGHF